MRQTFTKLLGILLLILTQFNTKAQKRIYLSNDDHTDYMWTQNEAFYKDAFINMLDWWINYNQVTSTNPNPYYRSKWNCDGSFWLSIYEKNKTAAEFDTLIAQVRRGQITVPYAPLACTYGGTPAEAVLRGMYYAGQLERRYNLDFNMAIAMENQTLPLGLASLWKGAGAKYCWHGVCNCETKVTGLDNRQNEIYWYKGLDTNKILMKWYSMAVPSQNYFIGGYAEAQLADNAVTELSNKINNVSGDYPYNVAAGFGVGHDALQTTNDELVATAMDPNNSNATQQVIVSNEVDFFRDFESNHGAALPTVTETLGNEWDLTCASIAELSAKMKRSLEKLRAAEAMSAIVTNYYQVFASPLDSLRKEAWNAIGLYWEHSLGFESNAVGLTDRYAFQTRLETTFSSYVDQLYNLAKSNLSTLITNSVPANSRFFAFNPLGWVRTDYADYRYNGTGPVHITDVASGTNTEVPSQLITKNGLQYLRIEAANIPSIGYKVFQINPGAGTTFPVTATTVDLTNNIIESDSFRITFTGSGVLTSVIDKKNNREIVEPGKYLNDLGSGNSNAGSVSLESNGPVSATILTTSNLPIPHTTRITLYKKIGRIEIDNQITQNFTDSVKNWTYSFNINDAEVWHEETGAVIRAKLKINGGHYAMQNARYDWSTLNHFASVNDTISNYGVSLSNQDCYFMKIGNSTVTSLDEGSAQLNVLAGGKINGLGFLDQGGSNVFNQRFAITVHTAYSAAIEMKKALEHQNFMVCDTVYNPVNFLLPNQYGFINNNDPGTLIWAVKPAEEGYDSGTVVRAWNLNNTDATPKFTSNLKMSRAHYITHVETNINDLSSGIINDSYDLQTSIGHNEMKTLRLKLIVIALPVKSLSFTGNKIQTSNILRWDNKGEEQLQKYELERSVDGQQFTRINTIIARNNNANSYNYSDNNLNIATPYYYRLKMISNNNSFSYSSTILIKAAKEASNIIIFPNPVVDILRANFILDKKTRCNVAVINSAGAVVKTVSPPLFERGNNYYMLPVKELPAGEYIFSVTAGDKNFVKAFIKK